MGLEGVKQDLLEQASKEANTVLNKAKEESRKILDEAMNNVKELEKQFGEDIKKLRKNLEIKETASANLEAQRQLQVVKKEIIDEVFKKVKDKIAPPSDKDRQQYMQTLYERAAKEISIGTIYCNSKDQQLIDFDNSEHEDCIGGLIAVDKTGTVKIDYTYETLLEELYDKYLSDASQILFTRK